jgi:hypothetical protein
VANGRVPSHDGVTDENGARAFDAQFDRLQHPMVTRRIVGDAAGKARRTASAAVVTASAGGCR